MMPYRDPGADYAHEQADELADALNGKGFVTHVYKSGGHLNYPCVEVSVGRWRLTDIVEYIYVARAEFNDWWFWWSSLGPIAPAKEVSKAADVIAHELAEIPAAGVRVV